MVLLHPIVVNGVIVEPAVPDEPKPHIPTRGYLVPTVLVEILPKVSSLVSTLVKVSGEGPLLMVLHPVGRAAVVVVGEDVVVMHVQTYILIKDRNRG